MSGSKTLNLKICAGAFTSGLLLFLAFRYPVCVPLFILGIAYTIEAGEKTNRPFLIPVVFFGTFIISQFSFMWNNVGLGGLEMILTLLPLAVYILPQVMMMLILRRFNAPVFLLTWLFSEVAFIYFALGNYYLLAGAILSWLPVFLQPVSVAGPFFATALLLLAVLAVKDVFSRRCFVKVTICFAIILFSTVLYLCRIHNDESNDRVVALVSLRSVDDNKKVPEILHSIRSVPVDYIIIPEAVYSLSIYALSTAPELLEIKRALNGPLENATVFLGLWLRGNRNERYNVLHAFDRHNNYGLQQKKIMVPFCEYLPLENITGKLKILDYSAPYLLSEMDTVRKVFRIGEDIVGAGICYEGTNTRYLAGKVKEGANVLVTVGSNSFVASRQVECISQKMGVLNAIGLNRTNIRVMESGRSFIISPAGKTIYQNDTETDAAIVSVPFIHTRSIYARYHLVFDMTWLIAAVIGCIIMVNKRT